MPYCSLEEAWGSDFKNDPAVPSSPVHSRIPPELAQNGLSNNPKPSPNIPSYSGVPSVSSASSAMSNIVPYKVNFPDRSRRNYIHPIDNSDKNEKENEDVDNFDILEDNENDTRYIDRQRKIKQDGDNNYLTSQDYFLYKKYLNLAEQYKAKLRKRFRDFRENEDNKEIIESFTSGGYSQPVVNDAYSIKDIFIIVIVGIFLIFALDIFVKIGSNMK
jgi:hypothetical protein